jgi:hypothetical protein
MANEIKITAGLRAANGNLNILVPSSTIQLDQTTARGGGPGTVDVGTTEETIDFGDIAAGFVHLRNLDETNFVEVGFSAGVYGMKLTAGSVAVFPKLTSATVYVKADTAGIKLQVTAVNE